MRQFGTKQGETGYAVAVDGAGNIYVAGQTTGVLAGTSGAGGVDVFIRKYDATATEVWTRQFGSAAADYPRAVGVDSDGNVYLFGWVSAGLPGQTALGERDMFLKKYDRAGAEVWSRQFGSDGDDLGYSMAIDKSGSIFVAGHVGGAAPEQTSIGGTDGFLRKYHSDGTEVWTRQFGSIEDDYARSLCLDGSGAIYVAGYSNGGAFPGQMLVGAQDAFVRKYDSNGGEVWTRQFGTDLRDIGTFVGVDATGGVYVTGYTQGMLAPTGNATVTTDLFARKYNGTGTVQWTRQRAGDVELFADTGAVNASGDVYIAGNTNKGFVAKYDTTGTFQWNQLLGSSGADSASAVTVDQRGTLYVVGGTRGAFPGQTSAGGEDAFVKALKP